MEPENGKTTVWIPREAFESVQRLWKPEFSWIPAPVDASLPPDRIAFIQTTGPVSPLPPLPPRPPRTPFSPFAAHKTPLGDAAAARNQTPYTPAGLLAPGLRAEAADYFGGGAVLSGTGVLAAGPADPEGLERPSTPATVSEPGSPSTPKNTSCPKLPEPQIWRPSQELQASNCAAQVDERAQERLPDFFLLEKSRAINAPVQPDYVTDSCNVYETAAEECRPVPLCEKPARKKKRRSGKRDFKMEDHWQTVKRDEAQWTESKKGFAVRLEVNLEMEVEIRGFVHGDITLSAESLYAL